MENMEVILYPKQIHISAQSSFSLRFTYKRISITTNHQLEKIDKRISYPIKNSLAQINQQIKFIISKEFELSNTKIVIVIIGVKGKDISCFGDISLDLAALKDKKMLNKEPFFQAKIDKCQDKKAFLTFDIQFIQKPLDLDSLKKIKKSNQKIPELGILKTEHYYKQDMYISRRQRKDKPTAYEISRRNYKNNEIVRDSNQKTINKQKSQKDQKQSTSNNGSYKKRFLYQVTRLDKSRQKSSRSKQHSHNYLNFYHKNKSPTPRSITPQPITLDNLKSKNQSKFINRNSHLNFQEFQPHQYQKPNQAQFLPSDTFEALPNYSSKKADSNLKPSYQKSSQSFVRQKVLPNSSRSERSPSSTNQSKSKYKKINQKLLKIEQKIREDNYQSQFVEGESSIKNIQFQQNHDQQFQTQTHGIKVNQRTFNSKKTLKGSPYQKTETLPHKNTRVQFSPTQSTCPRNQKPPSPILINQTPDIVKHDPDDFKMSEFTINSSKNEISNLKQQKSPKSSSPFASRQTQKYETYRSSFNQIPYLPINDQYLNSQLLKKKQDQQQKEDSSSKIKIKKKQTSPEKIHQRQQLSEISLDKKSSIGRNYIETQVKMLELEIQDKDNKYQKVEKKLIRKQQQYSKLIEQLQQYKEKIYQLSNQLTELKSKNLNLLQLVDQTEQIKNSLKITTAQLSEKQSQIKMLNEELNALQNKLQTTENQFQLKQIPFAEDFEVKKLEEIVKRKDQSIADLNQQLQNYKNQILSMKEINKQLENQKTKTNQQIMNNINYQKTIQSLQTQLKAYKKQKQSKSQTIQTEFIQEKQPILTTQSRSAQELLQKTIEKQQLLQQSLKSLETKNKTLIDQLLKMQIQSKELQGNLQSAQKDKNKLLEQIKINQNQKLLFQAKIKQIQNKNQNLSQTIDKKQKIIQKLAAVNEGLNTKLFTLQEQQKTKAVQLNQKIQDLVLKIAENQQQIKERNEKVYLKQKQIGILKQLLIGQQGKDQSSKRDQMRREIPSSSSEAESKQHKQSSELNNLTGNKDHSKSSQFIKIKVTEQGKENYYQNYLNQKAKCTNLEAQLRFAQNQIRNQKMRMELLIEQKKNLEQEIDMIAYNNDKDLVKKGLQHKVTLQSQSVTDTFKLENKVLKQEVRLLQTQVKDLNQLIDSAIQKTSNIQQAQLSLITGGSGSTEKNAIIQKQLAVLAQRIEAYEMELRIKKNKMAEIVNAIWRGGNANLIDEIDKIMGTEE